MTNYFDLTGQVAVVTGASAGLGAQFARILAESGADVAVLARRTEMLKSLAQEITRDTGRRCLYYTCDVGQEDSIREAVDAILADFTKIDILVNNAGIAQQTLFQDTDDAAWSRMLAVNLTGPRNTVMAALPHMLTEKRGCVVNVSSIWGLRGSSCETAYAASKAGLIGLTRSLALELAPSGIRVNAVAPGCIATDMVRALGTETRAMLEDETPMGRLGTPEEIAKAVCFLASDSASFITGQTLTIDGGFIV